MTGLVSSPTYGTVKRAELVIVKTLQQKMSDQIDAFRKVQNDIISQRAAGAIIRPVINYSRNIYPDVPGLTDDDLRGLHRVIKDLIDEGAVIFCSSGNQGRTHIGVSDSRRLNIWRKVF